MTARNGGAAGETRWEFPDHLSAARAVAVDTLPKVLEGYDPLELLRREKEVTSKLIRTGRDIEVRLVTFKLWQGFSIDYITLQLKKGRFPNPLSRMVWTPISMEIGPSATLKKRSRFSETRRGIIRVQFKVVKHLDRRTRDVHRELAIAEVQVL